MKHLFIIMLMAFTMTAAAQEYQYCEVNAYPTLGQKWKTVFYMDSIAPPPGIDIDKVMKWNSNAKWINMFAADRWELVSSMALSGQATMLIYIFKRKNLIEGKK